jgi:hypothetical protein
MIRTTTLSALVLACFAMACSDAPEYLAPRNLGFEAPFCDGPKILCNPPKEYEECLAEKIELTHEKLAKLFEDSEFIAYVDMDYDFTDTINGMAYTNFRKFEMTQILRNDLSIAGIDRFLLQCGYNQDGLCDSGDACMESVYSGRNLVFGNALCLEDKITMVISAAYAVEDTLIYDFIGRSSELAPLLEGINWGDNQITADEICVPDTGT